MVGNDNGVVYDAPETAGTTHDLYATFNWGIGCGVIGGLALLAGIARYTKYGEAGGYATYFVVGTLFLALMLCLFGSILYRLGADSYTEWWDGQKQLDESDTIHTYATLETAAS